MLACRMTRGLASDLLVRAARVIPADELTAACDRALDLGLATWVPSTVITMRGLPSLSMSSLAAPVPAWRRPT